MGISVRRGNYTDLRKMVYDLHVDLVTSGFNLRLHRNVIEMSEDSMIISPLIVEGGPSAANTGLYIFDTTQTVDPFSGNEPYNIVFLVHRKWWKVFVCTPKDLFFDPFNDAFSVSEYDKQYWRDETEPLADETRPVGALSIDSATSDVGKGQQFLNLDPEATLWESIKNLSVDENGVLELHSHPLSYRLTVGRHGLVFYTWAEDLDNTGDCQAWFCVQRPKEHDGTIEPSKGKHPIWCVYSQTGGGNVVDKDSEPKIDASGIKQFVVRERDIDLPSLSCSASVLDGDHAPIINPIEQNSIMENGKFVITIPAGLTSWRYSYPGVLDMIAFASADVSAHGYTVAKDIYDNGKPITYQAMKANRPENRGMRMFMQIDGEGTVPNPKLPLFINIKHMFRETSAVITTPTVFVEIELFDEVANLPFPAPEEIKIPFAIDQSSSAVEGIDYTLQAHSGVIVIPKGTTKGKLFGQVIFRSGDNGDRSVLFVVTDNLGDSERLHNPVMTIREIT